MSQQGHEASEDDDRPQLPIGTKNYVACRKCHSVLTEPQYMQVGCFKCGERVETREGLAAATTQKFRHFIGLVAPEHSWVARSIGCSHMPNGVYAAALDDEDDEDNEEDEYDDDDGQQAASEEIDNNFSQKETVRRDVQDNLDL